MKKRQAELVKKLGMDYRNKFLLHYARDITFLKGFRKDCIYYAFYCAEGLFKEMARRLELSLAQLRALHHEEIAGFLRGKRAPLISEERRKHSAIHFMHRRYKIYVGKKAGEFVEKLGARKKVVEAAAELSGTCTCPGKARGRARVVFTQHDIHKVR